LPGIYIHIPFCKQACHYCDFHFSTSLIKKQELLSSIKKEIRQRNSYLSDKNIDTIYFGGGTPSLLSSEEINELLDEITKIYTIRDAAEITLEANPDDLSQSKIKDLRKTGINRLSIGIQSFYNEDLRYMNRAHVAEQGEECVKRAQDAGIDNLTVDLIYGFPLLAEEKWKTNMEKAIQLDVPHLSCYSMTVEPRTVLAHFVRKGKERPVGEEHSAAHFLLLMKRMKDAGFIQYEISNFGKEGAFSRHNTSYWKGIHYIGFGPSAHSYDGESRQWNISNNEQYIMKIESGKLFFEREILTEQNKFNEYVMTGLRTMWGVDMNSLQWAVGSEQSHMLLHKIDDYSSAGLLSKNGNIVTLTNKGKMIADKISSELFI